MVFAFVILTIFIILPSVVTLDDTPLLKNLIQIVACKPNEMLTADYSTYDTPTSSTRSTDLSCVDNENQARDVSQQLIGIGAVGYLGPFLIGLFMALLAGAQTVKTKEALGKDRPKHDYARTQDLSDPMPEHVPLAQRLQELKEAHSAGLITEAEYTEKRRALLDEN
ncbi:MAG: SHOCT domain-containing protein [Chloroflexota bacterium]